MNYKCVFGNHLHGSESWNPGSESAQSVERELFRAIPRRICACLSGKRETAKEKVTLVKRIEQEKN